MLFHASRTPDLKILVPHVSNHGTPLIYFSQKRENVLVYLCNAVEKCCKEAGFAHSGGYTVWGPYGFNKDGILTLDEYYPNAVRDTYCGVKGYIYTVKENAKLKAMEDIPFAYASDAPVQALNCEFIRDAYEEILSAAKQGKIIITKYGDNSPKKLEWIEKTVREEYEQSKNRPEYRFFLKSKFDFSE